MRTVSYSLVVLLLLGLPAFGYAGLEDAKLSAYLQKRWTPARVNDFCRSENRTTGYRQNLVPHGERVSGELHTDKPELGRIWWYGSFEHGFIDDYSVNVKRGKHHWLLQIGSGTTEENDDDYFLELRIAYTLMNALDAYSMVHHGKSTQKLEEGITNRSLGVVRLKNMQLIKGETGKAISFSAIMPDGERLQVDLDEDQNVSRIHLNGRPDELWNKALVELDANLDKIEADNS